MIAAVIAGHCFLLKLMMILNVESIEWPKPRRTIFLFVYVKVKVKLGSVGRIASD